MKQKWGVSWIQFFLIFCTFALGGSLCARVGSWLLRLFLTEKSIFYWVLYIPLVTLLWPICVIVISIPLGQFGFFTNYLMRIWGKITGKASKQKLAIFASGAGSNALKIIEHFKNHSNVSVALIVCNKQQAGVLQVAATHHIPVLLLDKEQFFKGDAYTNELKGNGIDFIVLAGFLWKVPAKLVEAYKGKIINIHPALLPKYGGKGMYGQFVHEAVLASGDAESGITIHFVDEQYDHGNTIFQAKCPVLPNDTANTLAQRIHALEHEHFAPVIEKLLNQ